MGEPVDSFRLFPRDRLAMLVRPVMLAMDLPALQALWRATWRDTYGAVLGGNRLHLIDEAVAQPAVLKMVPADGGASVALVGGDLVGSVCFAERHGDGYVWGMYVSPDHQRRGVGSALLRSAAVAMPKARVLALSTVTPSSAAFYRHHGFGEVGVQDFEIFPGVVLPATSLQLAADVLRGGLSDVDVSPPA